MALISCAECGRQVSSNAATCPNCGNPIAAGTSIPAGEPVITTQATAKKFKGHQIAGIGISFFGIFLLMAGAREFAVFVIAVGVCWFFGARIAAWWHHE